MSKPCQVDFSELVKDDIDRLFDFHLERAITAEDLHRAQDVIVVLRQAIEVQLARGPFTIEGLVVPFDVNRSYETASLATSRSTNSDHRRTS